MKEYKLDEHSFWRLFELSQDAHLIIKNNKFVDCNLATIKMLKLKDKNEFMQTHPSELSPEYQPDRQLSFEKAEKMIQIAVDKGTNRFEWDHKRSDGEIFPVEVLLTLIKKEKEEIIIHTTWQDITERKRAELELEKAKEEAIRSNQLKSKFISNISHEIRTPLNGIFGMSELLLNDEISHQKKEKYVKIIQDSTEQFLKIVDDLLEINKFDHITTPLEFSIVDINVLIDEICEIYGPISYKTGIELRCISKEKVKIRTNKITLIKIIGNLIENAIKFTNEGYIELGCLNIENNKIEIYCKDSGIGISEDKHEFVFERFAQENQGFSRSYNGIGLGLSIVKENVNLLGGEIKLESEKDKGSKFTIILPIC